MAIDHSHSGKIPSARRFRRWKVDFTSLSAVKSPKLPFLCQQSGIDDPWRPAIRPVLLRFCPLPASLALWPRQIDPPFRPFAHFRPPSPSGRGRSILRSGLLPTSGLPGSLAAADRSSVPPGRPGFPATQAVCVDSTAGDPAPTSLPARLSGNSSIPGTPGRFNGVRSSRWDLELVEPAGERSPHGP